MSSKLPQIFDIQEGAGCIIRIENNTYQQRGYIDIRRYFRNRLGEVRPTRRGIVITPDHINELISALQAI